MPSHRLLADHIVTPDGVLSPALVEINGPRVVSCGPVNAVSDDPAEGGAERVAGWLVPGFVDLHVHGGGGHDYGADDPEDIVAARAFHARHGTTTSLASLVTGPLEVMDRQVSALADLVDAGHFAGIHLEGPFLSPTRCGAHDPSLLRPPDPASIERLLGAGRGRIATVTLAPELPGGIEAIGRFRNAGVRVAVGHTDAGRDVVAAALEAGATMATHLFNAMPSVHHREPGPVPLLTTDPRVSVELIADGFHVHPDVLRLVVAAAGSERVLLVTDAMAAAGMPDGRFLLGGRTVRVEGGRARLEADDGEPGPIAGSTATMAAVFAALTTVTGRIDAVAAMAATNAARLLGLTDVGRIGPGVRADLCVVDDGGVLQRVMRAGDWLADVRSDQPWR